MFEWHENFSVKIPFIDEQHKKLFQIGEKINTLLLEYDGDDSFDCIMDQIDALEKYTIYHFHEEEKMMRFFNYPELESHIVEHQAFIDYLHGLDVVNIHGKQVETLKELVKFVASWIFKHISNVDFQYSGFMEGKSY